MSGHTPGPWKVEPYGWIHTDYEGRSVAIIDWKSSSPKWTVSELSEQDAHNAHLIAAAPELLEALDACVFELESEHMPSDEVLAAIEKARSAMFKARGVEL